MVLIVELLNTGLENAIDRFGGEKARTFRSRQRLGFGSSDAEYILDDSGLDSRYNKLKKTNRHERGYNKGDKAVDEASLAEKHLPTDQEVLLKQICLLYKQIPLSSIMHFLLASFLAAVMTQVLPSQLVLLGWIWLVLLLICKYLLFTNFDEKADYSITQINRHYYMLCADALITGLSWKCWHHHPGWPNAIRI